MQICLIDWILEGKITNKIDLILSPWCDYTFLGMVIFKMFFLCPSFSHHLLLKFAKLLMVCLLKAIIIKHNFSCELIFSKISYDLLYPGAGCRMVIYCYLFQLRMKNKSVIQDLGVRIKTTFINWDHSTGIWNISLVNNQRFRSSFSHGPASVHLLHIFTRSVSG